MSLVTGRRATPPYNASMRVAIALSILLFSLNCASVQQGPVQRVSIDSEPRGATVMARDCGVVARGEHVTPATVTVSRRATRCTLELIHPDFDVVAVSLRRTLSPRTAGNVQVAAAVMEADWSGLDEFAIFGAAGLALFGAGLGVDFATGAMYEQNPGRIFVDFHARADERLWRERPEDVVEDVEETSPAEP